MSTRRGEEWGSAAPGPAELTVRGDDADLAASIATACGALIRFVPSARSDLAATLGIRSRAVGTVVTPDLLRLDDGRIAVSTIVLGTPPDRLRPWSRRVGWSLTIDDRPVVLGRGTGVVLAIGQYLRGNDVSPRGHPGDGRVEIQRYDVARRERSALRARLRQGRHLPHPGVPTFSGRRIEVAAERPVAVEIDGRDAGRIHILRAHVEESAYRLLV